VRVLSIIGARPQFVKMAVLARALAARKIEHRIIHTGQHYDPGMSDVFFEELGIAAPDHHLGIGSGTHGEQTGEMLKRLEPILSSEKPAWVLLYGDTNSTLAGAVAASKLGQKVAHIESGLRSFNRRMPEELNRIATDHLSDLLLCPTEAAMNNLRREGLADRALLTGDVMYDAFLADVARAEGINGTLAQTWKPGAFALATVHRAENTDDPGRLGSIMNALERISAEICPVALPLHPRTRKALAQINWSPRHVTLLEPVSYLQMLLLETRARMILTDSGGVQKEAYFARVPCVTLRDETEWVETLENGCNVLTGANTTSIVDVARKISGAGPWQELYGTGAAGDTIVAALLSRG
jgi:UDP-GlcNAc3NAcA epimerase